MRRFALLLVLAALVPAASACRRRPPSDPTVSSAQSEEARQKHNDASKLYKDKQYGAALPLYEEAYRIGHRHVSLLGAANCYRQLNRYPQAFDAYQHVLSVHNNQISKDERKEAFAALKMMNVPFGAVAIEAKDPDVEVEIDSRPAGRSPLNLNREFSAGTVHQIRVLKPGQPATEQTFQVNPQEQKRLAVGVGMQQPTGGNAPSTSPNPVPSSSAPPIEMSESERRAAARAAYIEGVEMQEKGDCPNAIQRFETAQRMFDAPTHILHLAECQVATGKLVEARENYNVLDRLKLAADAPDAFKKAQAQSRDELKKLTPRIPTLKIETAPPPVSLKNLTITSNGQRLPNELLGIARPVNPGPYRFVGKADRMSATVDADVKEGETKVVELKFAK